MKLDRLLPREVLTLLALMLSVFVTAGVASAAERPNILVILADDMGYSDISPYGGEIYTPSLAQLVRTPTESSKPCSAGTSTSGRLPQAPFARHVVWYPASRSIVARAGARPFR